MKTILVPIGGGGSDATVLDAALAVASALSAHLELLHVRVPPGDAARYTPHIDFARGSAIRHTMLELEADAARALTAARRHISDFCAKSKIEMNEAPHPSRRVTARWREEDGEGLTQLLFHARHHNLTVMSRPNRTDGLPQDRLERLLMESGRPLLITPASTHAPLLDHVVVCWKETADAARAVTAAMPLLTCARNVSVVAVAEDDNDVALALNDVANQMGWHGIVPEVEVLDAERRPAAEVLLEFAYDRGAGLMVMGGYGHSHTRQMIFGGCTQAIIAQADIAVLMAH